MQESKNINTSRLYLMSLFIQFWEHFFDNKFIQQANAEQDERFKNMCKSVDKILKIMQCEV